MKFPKILLPLIGLFVLATKLIAQPVQQDKPKLVVEIVVEQLRYEMIERYWEAMSENGIKRLFRTGISFDHMQYDLSYISNASGIATLATGTWPSHHGIIGDSWFDPLTRMQKFACGNNPFEVFHAAHTHFSPALLQQPTLGDMLKLQTHGKSKVVGISMNPVAAILGTGRSADLALWMNPRTGLWITNSYYRDTAIAWLDEFHTKQFHQLYTQRSWSTYYSPETYSASMADDNVYEEGIPGYRKTFPYELSFLKKRSESYKYLRVAPFGATYTKDVALTAIVREELGEDEAPDLLVVGFSNLAYATKYFHGRSMEIEDIFIRLDKDIAHMLQYFDQHFEPGEVAVVFTSDRGMPENRRYMADLGWSSGVFQGDKALTLLDTYLDLLYDKGDWLVGYANQQYYLSQQMIDKVKVPIEEIQQQAADFLAQFEGVAATYPLSAKSMVSSAGRNTLHAYRSGDVFVELLPGWTDGSDQFQVRGQRSSFNNHVPFVIWGVGRTGRIYAPYTMDQVAPSLARLLGVPLPGNFNKPFLPIYD